MDIHSIKELSKSQLGIISLFILFLLLIVDFPVVDIPEIFLAKKAEALIGRPATPASVGGTRRRTAAVVSAGTRVNTLPAGCSKAVLGGVTYQYFGGTYYRPYYEGENVVYVVEEP